MCLIVGSEANIFLKVERSIAQISTSHYVRSRIEMIEMETILESPVELDFWLRV